MTTACIVNDFVANRRTFLLFSEAEFRRVDAYWQHTDRLLVDLQDNVLFTKRLRWCDLEPFHYGCLIIKNLCYASDLTIDEQTDESNPVVRSLHFLLMALTRCIETRAHCSVEMLHVNRIAATEVAYSYTASINMNVDMPQPKGKDNQKLKVIIDNTRDEDEDDDPC